MVKKNATYLTKVLSRGGRPSRLEPKPAEAGEEFDSIESEWACPFSISTCKFSILRDRKSADSSEASSGGHRITLVECASLQGRRAAPPAPVFSPEIVKCAGGPRVPSHRCFRVLFVVRPGPLEQHCMRYRAYNVTEALRTVGVLTEHLDGDLVRHRLDEVLAFDLIVLVRRRGHRRWGCSSNSRHAMRFRSSATSTITCSMTRLSHRASTYDICRSRARQAVINEFRESVLRCRYYTGSTSYLTRRAASVGATSHPNSQRPECDPDRNVADRPRKKESNEERARSTAGLL